MTKRLEVRLEDDLHNDLIELASERRISISEAIREAIRLLREERDREERRKAVDEIAAMEIEEMPDPEELKRELDSMYDRP
jgi:Arc/MetJ-type ribon-helix-helix transcriptional regulator